MSISESFTNARKRCNLSQRELAEKIGVDRSFITQIENGLRPPSINVSINVALVLNCSIDELVGMDKIREDFWNEQLRKEV